MPAHVKREKTAERSVGELASGRGVAEEDGGDEDEGEEVDADADTADTAADPAPDPTEPVAGIGTIAAPAPTPARPPPSASVSAFTDSTAPTDVGRGRKAMRAAISATTVPPPNSAKVMQRPAMSPSPIKTRVRKLAISACVASFSVEITTSSIAERRQTLTTREYEKVCGLREVSSLCVFFHRFWTSSFVIACAGLHS